MDTLAGRAGSAKVGCCERNAAVNLQVAEIYGEWAIPSTGRPA